MVIRQTPKPNRQCRWRAVELCVGGWVEDDDLDRVRPSSSSSTKPTVTSAPGTTNTVPVERSYSAPTAIPTAPTCESPAIRTGRTGTAVGLPGTRATASTLKIRLVIAAGNIGQRTTWHRHLSRRPTPARSDRDDWHDQLLKRWPAMVEGEVAAGAKDADAHGEYEVKVRVVAEASRRDPYAGRRRRTATADPAASVEVDGLAARSVDPHRLVAVLRGVQMAVVSRDDGALDPNRGELANGAGEVLDHSVHDRPGLEATLSKEIDLLRADDDAFSVPSFFASLALLSVCTSPKFRSTDDGTSAAKYFLRAFRSGRAWLPIRATSFRRSRPRVVARGSWHQRRHPVGSDARQDA